MQVHRDFPPFTGLPNADSQGVIGAGCCTRCGRDRKPTDPGVVDVDVQFYSEGVVVFCWPCAQEIGSLAGMATPEALAVRDARIAALEAVVAERDAALAAVDHLLVALELVADAASVRSLA